MVFKFYCKNSFFFKNNNSVSSSVIGSLKGTGTLFHSILDEIHHYMFSVFFGENGILLCKLDANYVAHGELGGKKVAHKPKSTEHPWCV